MDSRDDENEYIRQLTEQNRQQADQLQHQAARIRQLEAELERLKHLLAGKADSKTAKKPLGGLAMPHGGQRQPFGY